MHCVIIHCNKLKNWLGLMSYKVKINNNICLHEYVTSIDVEEFGYYPVHFGYFDGRTTIYDSFLLNSSDNIEVIKSSGIIQSEIFALDEVFTFEFESEEDALYFKLKYCS